MSVAASAVVVVCVGGVCQSWTTQQTFLSSLTNIMKRSLDLITLNIMKTSLDLLTKLKEI